jgi:hypothetical protein
MMDNAKVKVYQMHLRNKKFRIERWKIPGMLSSKSTIVH